MRAIIRNVDTISPVKRDMSDISTNGDYRRKFYSVGKNKLKVERYSHEGDYNGRITIPSEQYPLVDKASFKIFYKENCKEITNAFVLECFDKIKYRAGHCYSMADELSRELCKYNIAHNLWCGWLFTDVSTTPIYHCWVTVGQNDESVLDPQDDVFVFGKILKDNNVDVNDRKLSREFYKQFLVERMNGKVSNTDCCYPIGVPIQFYYVGCKITNVNDARRAYTSLIRKYPNHSCNDNVIYENGMTQMQYELYREM